MQYISVFWNVKAQNLIVICKLQQKIVLFSQKVENSTYRQIFVFYSAIL